MLIDAALHPPARRDGRFYLVDGLLYALVERKNPPASIRKYVKYNLPSVLSQLVGTDAGIVSAGSRMLRGAIRLAREDLSAVAVTDEQSAKAGCGHLSS